MNLKRHTKMFSRCKDQNKHGKSNTAFEWRISFTGTQT